MRFLLYNRTLSTTKRYTIVHQCCDPAEIAEVYCSNNLAYMEKIWAKVKDEAEARWFDTTAEFSCYFWEHPNPGTRVQAEVMVYQKPGYHEHYIYNVDFPNSKELHRFTYMGLHFGEDEEYDEEE